MMSEDNRRSNVLREEFRVKHLKLNYEHYEYFVYSQCLPAWLLWLLRLGMGGFCLGVFVYLSVTAPFMSFERRNDTSDHNSSDPDHEVTVEPAERKTHFYLCFLTVWSYLVITVYFLVTLGNMVAMKCRLGRSYTLAAGGFKSTEQLVETEDELGHVSTVELRQSSCGGCHDAALKLQWLLYGVAANAAVIVTVGYFGFIYRFVQQYNPGPVAAVDLFVHGLNSVFMFVEVVSSGVPVHIVHALFTALYGLAYGLFSLVYWLPDHSNVMYPVLLDWNNAGLTLAIVSGILLVGLPLIQLFWWAVYLLRCAVARLLLPRTVWHVPGVNV